MEHESPYDMIGEQLFVDMLDQLVKGTHLALLGPSEGGKSLVLDELIYRAQQIRKADRPTIIRMDSLRFYKRTSDNLVAEVARILRLHHKYNQETLSGKLHAMIKDWIRKSDHPLWIFVGNIIGYAAPIAREILYAFSECHYDKELKGRLGVVVTGSCDFIPLTYEQLSPFRHAKKIIIIGLSLKYAEKVFCVLRLRQRGENVEIRNVTESDIIREITPKALKYLYDTTGGQMYLLQQIVLTSAQIINNAESKLHLCPKQWDKKFVEDHINRFVNIQMQNDLNCRMVVREFVRDPSFFDLILRILKQGKQKIKQKTPIKLEVAGIVRRDLQGNGTISCDVWQRFLKLYLTERHIADIYAWQRRWHKAWSLFDKLPEHHRDRPISGNAVFRLRSTLSDWEDSLLDYVSQGPRAVWRQFLFGVKNLLGFDGWSLLNKENSTTLYPEYTQVSDKGIFVPDPTSKSYHQEIQKQPKRIYDQDISARKYWLDEDRMRLFCDPQIELKMPTNIGPALFLERKGFGNEIDTMVQKYLWHAVDRFWHAFIAACEIEYREGIGELRERHLKVIEHVNKLLLKEPFKMGKIVQETVNAIVSTGLYYRAQICLVDPKREYIQSVASSCKEPKMNINFPTNYPLENPNQPIEEWDSQPWVVRKKRTVVIPDASNPKQKDPRTPPIECGRLGMKAITIVPMLMSGEVTGTIHFERLDKEVPSEAEVGLYEVLAGQLAMALHVAYKITLLQRSLLALPDRIKIVSIDRKLVFDNQGKAKGWQVKKDLCRCERVKKSGNEDHNCLIYEIKDDNGTAHHYSIQKTDSGHVEAKDWLMAPIDDFRKDLKKPFKGAHFRIGYIERVHDLSDLYQLYITLQDWLSETDVRATAKKILQFFKNLGFRWGQIYLLNEAYKGSECLESLEQFGMKEPQNISSFRSGEVKFFRGGSENLQPWHIIDDVRDLSIYKYNGHIQQSVMKAPPYKGMTQYWTSNVQKREHLEINNKYDNIWIEAPLLVGQRPIGKMMLSMLPEIVPGKWELLKNAVVGVAVALDDALRSRREAKQATEETWKMAAAQTVHQLTQKVAPIESWLVYTLRYLYHKPAKAKVFVKRAEKTLASTREILKDLERYASDKPFTDIKEIKVSKLLEYVVSELKVKHPNTHSLRIMEKIPNVSVSVSQKIILEVFENLINNSIDHSGKKLSTLEVTLRADYSKAPKQFEDGKQYVRIQYIDNGKGIADNLKEYIFDPFYIYESKGTGLGLTIARRYIRRHGGEIIEQGEYGKGVCFAIYLPSQRKEPENEKGKKD